MGHVEESAGRISLHSHILGLREPGEGPQCTRSRDLCFVLFVCSQISDATDGVALHLDILGHHLADQRRQSTKLDNGDLVVGCARSDNGIQLDCYRHTVYSQVA